ncbi:MAG: hypothetical protein A2992_03795 [Elusimicrobia bacterium RIFCSPLOWO2_01_FULL_59_12]|nr:MAG: hypothetical protein A2992_03795 [Elusimicrobia bacterium RIFCSPLOWO2_01_FULL_59_12]
MKQLILALVLAVCAYADELGPYVPKSRAPLDPRQAAADTHITPSEAEEVAGELGGILYMAQEKYAYEKWAGKGISDCSPWTSENGCIQCRLIMGRSIADYYFFKPSPMTGQPSGQAGCSLQQVDARFQVSDPHILKRLRRTVQWLFGSTGARGEKPASKETGWDGSGPGWTWQTDEDLAFLYMDTEQASPNGEGLARFQWRRSPLHRHSPRP